jgi:quercetin dioxygenase-like cupin family protein
MIKYIQLPFHFDAFALQKDVTLLNAISWKMHYQKLHYEGEWSAIPLRSINGNAENVMISPIAGTTYLDTIFLQECPYIQQVLQQFHCELMAVRLLKLNAGAVIKEHRDAELNFEKGEVRIHIPVTTHPLVEFYLDQERILLQEGECWYMNFNLPHHINNFSPVNRVHLVIDAKVNDWVKDLFASEAIAVKKEVAEKDLISDEVKKLMIARFREMDTETTNQLADKLEKELMP